MAVYQAGYHPTIHGGLEAKMPSALELLESIRAQMLKCLGVTKGGAAGVNQRGLKKTDSDI